MGFEPVGGQKDALQTYSKDVLISAGAGSGKTEILGTKVKDILLSGQVKPDEILVVTFTVAAAFEMKERIKDKLKEANADQKIIDKIDSSHVSTFDSFALYIVKRYAQKINVSENISIIDKEILDLKTMQFLDEIFIELYKERNQDFITLLKHTCFKTDNELKEIIQSIFNGILKQSNSRDIIEHYKELYIDKNNLENHYYDFLKQHQLKIKETYILNHKPHLYSAREYEEIFRNEVMSKLVNVDLETFRENLINGHYTKPTAGKKYGLSKNDTEIDKEFGKLIINVKTSIKKYKTLEINKEHNKKVYDDILIIMEIIKKLNAKVEHYKKLTNTYTFSDIAQFATKILEMEDVNKEIKSKFKFILVDEYQDTNDVQERMVQLIRDDNVYMVGDIKQSIYRFRGANCDIFRDKYNSFTNCHDELVTSSDPSVKGVIIDMDVNFRCRHEVIDTVNEMFDNIMTEEMGGANYKLAHNLKVGLDSYKNTLNIHDKDLYGIKKVVFDENEKNQFDNDAEFEAVANKIAKLLTSGVKIFDKYKKAIVDGVVQSQLRDIQPKDIAILCRRKSRFLDLKKALVSHGIPVSVDIEESYHEYDPILVFESILRGITYLRNEIDDDTVKKYVFTSIARSYLYKLSDEEIYNFLNDGTWKNHEIFEKLSRIAEISKDKSKEDVVNSILVDFEILKKLDSLDKIKSNIEKIEFIVRKAKSFDESRLTFEEFNQFFIDLKDYDIDLMIESKDDQSNAVKIMTIHKSKGLEFPFVFLIETKYEPKKSEFDGKASFSKEVGVLLSRLDDENEMSVERAYVKNVESKEIAAEELRLLYVALTRAREGLYFYTSSEEELNPLFPMTSKKSYSNFVKVSEIELEEEYVDDKTYIYNNVLEDKEITKNAAKPKKFRYSWRDRTPKTASTAAVEEELSEEDIHVLEIGIKYHEFMELIDFRTKDTSFIKDDEIRRKISKVLSSPTFEVDGFIDVYKEYEFIDEEENVHGFIDMFMVFDDEVRIFDYKLSSINKEEYKKQLLTYKNYIEKIFKKRCRTFLISLNKAVCEEIIL